MAEQPQNVNPETENNSEEAAVAVVNEAVSSAEIRDAVENNPPAETVSRFRKFLKDNCGQITEKDQLDVREAQLNIISAGSGLVHFVRCLAEAAFEIAYETAKNKGKMTAGKAYEITNRRLSLDAKKEKK